MAEKELRKLLDEAKSAKEMGAKQRAAELYQAVIDRKPYSDSAQVAGERLQALKQEGIEPPASGDETVMEDVDAPESEGEPSSSGVDGGGEAGTASNDWQHVSSEKRCSNCGASSFQYGSVYGKGYQDVTFDPADGGVFETDSQPVKGRVCVECGYLEHFVERPEEYRE